MNEVTKWIGELITNNLGTILISGILSAVAWFFTKRHFQDIELKQAEVNVESNVTDNVVKHLDVYKRLFEDLDEQLIKANKKIKELEIEIEDIENLYKQLKQQYENNCN